MPIYACLPVLIETICMSFGTNKTLLVLSVPIDRSPVLLVQVVSSNGADMIFTCTYQFRLVSIGTCVPNSVEISRFSYSSPPNSFTREVYHYPILYIIRNFANFYRKMIAFHLLNLFCSLYNAMKKDAVFIRFMDICTRG